MRMAWPENMGERGPGLDLEVNARNALCIEVDPPKPLSCEVSE